MLEPNFGKISYTSVYQRIPSGYTPMVSFDFAVRGERRFNTIYFIRHPRHNGIQKKSFGGYSLTTFWQSLDTWLKAFAYFAVLLVL